MSSVCPWLCQVSPRCRTCSCVPLSNTLALLQAAGTWQKSTGTSSSFLNSKGPAEGSTETKRGTNRTQPNRTTAPGGPAAARGLPGLAPTHSVPAKVDLYGRGGWVSFFFSLSLIFTKPTHLLLFFSVTRRGQMILISSHFGLRCCLCLWLNKKKKADS